MRTVYALDPIGYPTELYTQTPDDNGSYPPLTEEQTAIPPPEGMYRRRFDRKTQTWVDEVTEAELYEMAYREKHRELVQAATEEFVGKKPGYTLEERLMQSIRDLHSLVRQLEARLREIYPDAAPIQSAGYAGDEQDLLAAFDGLYTKLVALDKAQTRAEIKEIDWTS